MVTKFGGQILATKFGFVPDCILSSDDLTQPPALILTQTHFGAMSLLGSDLGGWRLLWYHQQLSAYFSRKYLLNLIA